MREIWMALQPVVYGLEIRDCVGEINVQLTHIPVCFHSKQHMCVQGIHSCVHV